jgi:hypothetical protein
MGARADDLDDLCRRQIAESEIVKIVGPGTVALLPLDVVGRTVCIRIF